MPINTPLPRLHLLAISRDQERFLNREGYLRLDRNERVSPLSERNFREMISLLTVDTLMAYPDAGAFVSRLAAITGLPENHILPTAGSDGAIRRIFTSFISPGDIVQIANPTYAMYDVYSRIFQASVRKIDYPSSLKLDVDAFVDAITPGTRMVALADPDQPSGSTLNLAETRRILEKCAQVGALCVVDEAYYPFHPVTAVPLVREYDNLLVVRSFSKLPGAAGLRLGCAFGNPSLLAGLDVVRGANEVSSVTLLFGCYFLDHPEIADEFRNEVEKGRALMIQRVTALGFRAPPCAGNFQLLQCPPGVSAPALGEQLKARRVLVKAGFGHPSVKDCIRVSLNGPDIMGKFCDILELTLAEASSKDRDA